jgi:DNA-binding response OmpR family regulator
MRYAVALAAQVTIKVLTGMIVLQQMRRRTEGMDRVALISDQERFTRDATRALHDEGYTVFTGGWQEPCIATLKTFEPNLIVLHYTRDPAPDADMAALLEADEALCLVPVLMCSDEPSLYQASFRESACAPGALQASTCQIEELLVKVRAMLATPDPGKTVA